MSDYKHPDFSQIPIMFQPSIGVRAINEITLQEYNEYISANGFQPIWVGKDEYEGRVWIDLSGRVMAVADYRGDKPIYKKVEYCK